MSRVEVRIDDLLEGEAAPERLTCTQLLLVMDRLLECEASWHAGNSLAQTVFTCLYMLRIDRTVGSPLLHAYCMAVKVTSQLIRSIILNGSVAQEEDFLPHTSWLPIEEFSVTTHQSCINALESLEEALQSRRQDEDLVLGTCTVGNEESPALIARLRFRRLMLLGLAALRTGGTLNAGAGGRWFAGAAAELKVISTSFSRGTGEQPVGFHPDVNRSRTSPTPPRPVKLKTRDECHEYFATLLQQLSHVCQFTTISGFTDLRMYMTNFSRNAPGPIASSALYALMKQKLGDGNTLQEMLLQEFSRGYTIKQVLPPEVSRACQTASKAVLSWVRIMCLNLGNQRRKLRRSAEDWAFVMNDAIVADRTNALQENMQRAGMRWPPEAFSEGSEPVEGPISTWVEVESARVMLHHLQLGWELELYMPHEFCMVCRYSDYLLEVIVSGSRLLRATSCPTKKKAKSAAAQHKLEDLHMEINVLQVHRIAYQAFVRLLAGLRLAKLLPSEDNFHSTEEQRYEQRFNFLQLLSKPEPLWYEHYQVAVDTGSHKAEHLLTLAEQCFQQARTHAELALRECRADSPWEPDLAGLKRVTQQNTVAISVLKTLMSKGASRLVISWDMPHHRHFPVMGIKQQTT